MLFGWTCSCRSVALRLPNFRRAGLADPIRISLVGIHCAGPSAVLIVIRPNTVAPRASVVLGQYNRTVTETTKSAAEQTGSYRYFVADAVVETSRSSTFPSSVILAPYVAQSP